MDMSTLRFSRAGDESRWPVERGHPCERRKINTSMTNSADTSLYHLFEDESRTWAERTGGSVVELHAYAVEPGTTEAALREDLRHAFHSFYPEYAGARVIARNCW